MRIRKENVLLWFLYSGYLILNGLARWQNYYIFHGDGPFGWPTPSELEVTLLCASVVSSIFIFCLIPFIFVWMLRLGSRRPLVRRAVVSIFFLVSLILIELDLAWYQMSLQHASLADLEAFLTEDWTKHFGVTTNDVHRYVLLFSIHGVAVILINLVAVFLCNRPTVSEWLKAGPVAAILVVVIVIDLLVSAYFTIKENQQWNSLTHMNPLSIGIVAKVVEPWTARAKSLVVINKEFDDMLSLQSSLVAPVAAEERKSVPLDVLLIIVEGFNPNFVGRTTMPFLTSFSEKGVQSKRHYSSGNITAYGLLGLLFGSPLEFYRGVDTDVDIDSPFIDALNAVGYRTSIYTDPIHDYRSMGRYMSNFSGEVFESDDHWEILPKLVGEMRRPEKKFVMAYYYGTHYPYHHEDAFTKFLPEVPESFNYNSPELRSSHEEVINRYKNTLLEADAWLKKLLVTVDLENTVVAITGDHGEEFFENGRLSHAATLEEPQIRTPMIFWSPPHGVSVSRSITSHLDFFPTVFDLIGLSVNFDTIGRSMVTSEGENFAIVVGNNGKRLPKEWAVITHGCKVIYELDAQNWLRVSSLLGDDDQVLDENSELCDYKSNLRIGADLAHQIRRER